MIVRDNYAEGIVFREHLSKQKTSFEVEKLQKVFSKDMKGSRIWSLLPSVLNLSKKFGYLKIIFQANCNDKYWYTLFTISTSI